MQGLQRRNASRACCVALERGTRNGERESARATVVLLGSRELGQKEANEGRGRRAVWWAGSTDKRARKRTPNAAVFRHLLCAGRALRMSECRLRLRFEAGGAAGDR